VWEWYAWRRSRIAACDPNPAHRVLAEWSRRFPNFRLITQNVDGLHESAFRQGYGATGWPIGCNSPAWIDLGSQLLGGCAKALKRWRDETLSFDELPPRCPHCGGPIRPGVVWFGETLDPAVVRMAVAGGRV
jgi:NAD-dependent deacetylase